MCVCVGRDLPSTSQMASFIEKKKKKKEQIKKMQKNKGEESADIALHEELHYLFLDLCLEDKEIYTSPCWPSSFL